MRGMVFDIQRFSVHNGPGIRTTVFLKGCPLRCPWCQNPESQSKEPELFFTEALCKLCGECVKACPNGVHMILKGKRIIRRNLCSKLGRCVEACPTGALEFKGRLMTVGETLAEVLRDSDYYDRSGGGITLSGGEPLFQPGFAIEILKACKELRLHTAIETSGHARPSTFDKVTDFVDLVMYDLKHMDPRAHKALTGVSNDLIFANLRKVVAKGVSLLVRLPLIPGFNDTQENLLQIAGLLRSLGIYDVEILPYHNYFFTKYKALGIDHSRKAYQVPSAEKLRAAETVLKESGIRPRTALSSRSVEGEQ
jgi:pyruvate formate lyase activating enzyme